MPDNKDIFLSVENLVVEYRAGKDTIYAVNGVSFQIGRGKTLGLVGETGAGKTTIAKAIMRILPNPQGVMKAGAIRLEGENMVELPEEKMQKIRGNKISMIFQDPMTALNPLMTVGEQIVEAFQLHNQGLTYKEACDKAIEMLEMVGIPGQRFEEYPHQFSGGMKQRVVIAMALVCNPQLILADEPTTALDVTIQAQVLDLIKDLQERLNTAMLLITHDLGVVAETCDDVAVIYGGKIVEKGSKWDVFMHPAHPYTKGLFDSVPKLNDEEGSTLHPIPGMPMDPSVKQEGCGFCARCKHATEVCSSGEVPAHELESGHICYCHFPLEKEGSV